jgi:hypothetical protein
MRRSQTTILTTLAVVASLLFMSQFPAISPVANVHPDDTTQLPPPNTDSDGDMIPDVHESLFEEWLNWTNVDGREISIKGLDKNDATDAALDLDRDGLNSTEEFCWPYPANCTAPGFPRGLTGKTDENGDRLYLDPRKADTDGDGLPDGFEAYMCERIGGFNIIQMRYNCLRFDPLNASDLTDDPDDDGFDINRDGDLSVTERFTSAEEYIFGATETFVTELDGLWCQASLPDGAGIRSWPYIGNGANATFVNILEACTTNATGKIGDDMWLGTDPLLDDSDRYHWDGFAIRPLFPSFGDGMTDGWEVHFGLDPLNRTNALVDDDNDGWDRNRDGIITSDLSRTQTALAVGEALSNIQEYNIHFDNGNTIYPGLKSSLLQNESTVQRYPLMLEEMGGVESIHHDIKSLLVFEHTLHIITTYGISSINLDTNVSEHQWFPQGLRANEGVYVSDDGVIFAIAMATSFGVSIIPLLADGTFASLDLWTHISSSEMNALTLLASQDGSPHILALGSRGEGMIVELSSGFDIDATYPLGVGIVTELFERNATVNDVAHGINSDGESMLAVATHVGLVLFETATGRDEATGNWIAYYDPTQSNFGPQVDSIRPMIIGTQGNPAEIRTVVFDGPSEFNHQVLWFGTPAGVHRLDTQSGQLTHSGLLAHPGIEGKTVRETNSIYSIYPTGDELLIGSEWGLWAIAGDYAAVYGLQEQTRIPGEIVSIAPVSKDGVTSVFAAASPGQFSNLKLINPLSNDSDADGIPDGWEFENGLDPTDPWDAQFDFDGDGIDLDASGDGVLERLWVNLDEYRYVQRTLGGFNSTDPQNGDTDGDGLSDGAEYYGFFFKESTLWCHYTIQMVYQCDTQTGQQANATYLNQMNIDFGTDPTNIDSDGDGMPDGWEIEHRRWIGSTFTGGNNWTLDPHRPEDANWDADSDGLANLCEYQWSLVRLAGLEGELIENFGEVPEAVENWSVADPNSIDSDGDSLPDGWESDGRCTWSPEYNGVNPLNGSDVLSNPDGDGYDINHDGILTLDEQFVNYLEYHLRSDLFVANGTLDGEEFPFEFETGLFDFIYDYGEPEDTFAERAFSELYNSQTTYSVGAANPWSADSDTDGMPDGWEIWFSRWNLLDDAWTLNPLDSQDRWQDADDDGMTNWEEYNSIDPMYSEIQNNRSSPQWFVTTVGAAFAFQQWPGIPTSASFGSFIDDDIRNTSGMTTDPNNIDTDGDGMLDGLELLFTAWNTSAEVWTLNPLVPDDGNFDGDEDGLIDKQEFALATLQPDNGIEHPSDAPLLHIDGDLQQPTEKAQRIFNILISKNTRGKRLLDDFNAWQSGEPPNAFISVLQGMTDPTSSDTDGDGMFDGFEYWFTSWDLDENRWSMNPLIDGDVYLDSDDDSYDCNGDGDISLDERFSNLREWESRTWGKYDRRDTVPLELGIIDFGEDAILAYQEELGYSGLQAQLALYQDFIAKGPDSVERMAKINSLDSGNFNRSLRGVADPTHPDSDSDGIPDGWEYCYAIFGMNDLTTINHWSSNPLNPFDVNYDGDHDGWYNRTTFDQPAVQGQWQNRIFTPISQQIQPGIGNLPFTNSMEYMNQTRPDLNDSDGDSVTFITTIVNGVVVSHVRDYNYSDGREVFKYGSNPSDNDSDGDMLPDWYEYKLGWNESNDNFSSFFQIEVQWIDPATGGACTTATNSCLPLSLDTQSGELRRPNLNYTWFTLDPADPNDANEDPDKDGNWDCTGAGCTYEPYTNFQEFYAFTLQEYSSPNAVRLSGLTVDGNLVTEWWQLRKAILGIGQSNELILNYLKMDKYAGQDFQYGYIVNDNDVDFFTLNSSDDVVLLAGNRTDAWEIYYQFSPNTAPDRNVGEHEFGWYILDFDDDHLAEGSNPMNWDTDGDWLVDWFEVRDDEEDGVRGQSSPIRYDSRQT